MERYIAGCHCTCATLRAHIAKAVQMQAGGGCDVRAQEGRQGGSAQCDISD